MEHLAPYNVEQAKQGSQKFTGIICPGDEEIEVEISFDYSENDEEVFITDYEVKGWDLSLNKVAHDQVKDCINEHFIKPVIF